LTEQGVNVSNLRRSLFSIAFYLLVVLMLGLLDGANRPVINFASYFYVTAVLIVPAMIFIPSLHKVSIVVPMIFWATIYFALLKLIDRGDTGSTAVEVVVLEFLLIEVGVWLSFQMASAIESSESLMDIMAQGTFPHRAVELDAATEKIKIEFSRSRRYHRPISLIVVHAVPKDEDAARELLKSLQRDMLSRLSNARIGQAIGESIRQTDLLLRDQIGRFIVLCPETSLESATFLGERVCNIVAEKTGLRANFGVASFPDEALTFEDLLHTARDRSTHAVIPINLEISKL
jgi:hypothetical protein